MLLVDPDYSLSLGLRVQGFGLEKEYSEGRTVAAVGLES